MQIKTTMRYHLTPIRMAIIKKSTNNKGWWGCGEMGALVHCWWDCEWVQPLWKKVWRFLKKLKIELPYDPLIPLLGIYLKINENTNSKRCLLSNVHSSTIYNSQDMEATQVSINRWMNKEDMVYIQWNISHKKNEILPFAAMWMDLKNIMLSEISQTEKDKYCMLSLLCGI